MNPITIEQLIAVAGALGIVVNGVWTLVNIRAEARIGRQIDGLKGFIAQHYVCKLDCPLARGCEPEECLP